MTLKHTFKLSAVATALLTSFSLYAAEPITGPYVTDPQSEHVSDQLLEGLNMANSVLCYIANSRGDAMVNKGHYVALLDADKCEGTSTDASQSSNTTSTGSTKFMPMSLTVTRASNTDPQIAIGHAYPDTDVGGHMPVYLYLTQTEGPSTANPNGLLSMDYTGILNNSKAMRGRVAVTANGIEFSEVMNEGSYNNQVRLYYTGDETSGSGAIEFPIRDNQGNLTSNFYVGEFAYDANNFCRRLAGDNTSLKCFTRSKSSAKKNVWRYGVYDDATGAQYDLPAPGFSVKTASGSYGFASYWGIWTQDGLSNGDIVTKANDSSVNFTVKKTGGKLTKYTRTTTTLDSINKVPFSFYASNPTGNNQGANVEVYWDKDQAKFVLSGIMNCANSNGCYLARPSTPTTWTASNVISQTGNWGLNGWSQSLGGSVYLPNDTLVSSTPGSGNLTYQSSTVVLPGDTGVPTNLVCVRDCPTATTIATTSPFTANTANKWWGTQAVDTVSYTWDGSAYTLSASDGALSASLLSSSLPQQYKWGIRTGALIDSASLSDLTCNGTNTTDGYCDGKAQNLSTYYQFETGTQSWNVGVYLQNADSSFVRFTPPETAIYTVPSDATKYGAYAGATMNLRFMGFGNLNGIPGKCIDPATNAEADCSSTTKWVPAFAIPSGGQVTINNLTKWVKWLDRELRFEKLTDSDATTAATTMTFGSAANLPTAVSLSGTDTTDPSNSTNATYAGDWTESLIKETPAVIHGVVQ